jgi:hypothetical protein
LSRRTGLRLVLYTTNSRERSSVWTSRQCCGA